MADSTAHSSADSTDTGSTAHQLIFADFAAPRLTSQQIRAVTPIALAYIGDAVFELYVRSHLLLPAKRIQNYHTQVVNHVKAEQQSHYADVLLPHLNDSEKDILRRGRNATAGKQRRATAQHYQQSTGFEALLGFLYLSDQPRLIELLDHLPI